MTAGVASAALHLCRVAVAFGFFVNAKGKGGWGGRGLSEDKTDEHAAFLNCKCDAVVSLHASVTLFFCFFYLGRF